MNFQLIISCLLLFYYSFYLDIVSVVYSSYLVYYGGTEQLMVSIYFIQLTFTVIVHHGYLTVFFTVRSLVINVDYSWKLFIVLYRYQLFDSFYINNNFNKIRCIELPLIGDSKVICQNSYSPQKPFYFLGNNLLPVISLL